MSTELTTYLRLFTITATALLHRRPGRRQTAENVSGPDPVALAGRHRRRRDDGYSTEAVIVTALLAAAALTVMAIIVAKVTNLANSITL